MKSVLNVHSCYLDETQSGELVQLKIVSKFVFCIVVRDGVNILLAVLEPCEKGGPATSIIKWSQARTPVISYGVNWMLKPLIEPNDLAAHEINEYDKSGLVILDRDRILLSFLPSRQGHGYAPRIFDTADWKISDFDRNVASAVNKWQIWASKEDYERNANAHPIHIVNA